MAMLYRFIVETYSRKIFYDDNLFLNERVSRYSNLFRIIMISFSIHISQIICVCRVRTKSGSTSCQRSLIPLDIVYLSSRTDRSGTSDVIALSFYRELRSRACGRSGLLFPSLSLSLFFSVGPRTIPPTYVP